MRKSLVVLLAVGAILLNIAISGTDRGITTSERKAEISESVEVHPFEFIEEGGYTKISMENAYYLHSPGEPMLPYYTKVYYFPLGTKVKVDCTPKSVETMKIERPIIYAPPPKPLNGYYVAEDKPDEEIYGSKEAYPAAWYSYRLGGGLVDGERVTILALHVYPMRYKPAMQEMEVAGGFNIKIEYVLPQKSIVKSDEYDLVIICPQEWKNIIQPLVDHKEQHGVRTFVETVENIYSSYEGRDGAEKVKYFIKDMIEQYNVKYVLLIGGKKSYITGNWGYDGPTKHDDSLWYCPVRYVALDDNAEKGYISDLYFADIYDAEGNFSTWDTNNDGIYGAWTFKYGKDILDLYPDVYVGRLACRSEKELQNVIDKILTYENGNVKNQDWFKKMLLVGGDTFNDVANVAEGEVSTLWFYEQYMADDFEKVSLFVTDGTLPLWGATEPNELAGRFAWINVIKTYSQGCGFAVFDGHGSPTAWATHFLGYASHSDPWVNGLMTYNMDLLQNNYMTPVFIIGGCHNSEFNISLLDFMKNEWTYQPTYECFGWHIVKMAKRGAIATIGNTGLGYGAEGGDRNGNGIPDCVEYNGGYIEERFFYAYGVEGKEVLGETWGTAITLYLNTYDAMADRIDCKTVEEWVLLGDPTLKIGGY